MTASLIKEDTTMKRIIIFAALAAFALTSCQQEITIEESKPEGLVFTATTEIPATKTALDASLNVVWQAGDEITVMGGSSIGTYTTTADGDTKATFTRHSGSEATTSPYKAWYPTTLYNNVTLVLPASQTYTAGNIAGNPMYAESETANLSFKNICGIIKLNISTMQTGKKVRKIVLSADQGMSGEISNVATLATDLAAGVTGTAGVTLDCGTEGVEIGSTAIPFYISVPAADYENLAITVETTDGLQQTKKLKAGEKVTVARSIITDVSLTFNDFVLVIDLSSTTETVTIPAGVNAKLTGSKADRIIEVAGGGSVITLEDASLRRLILDADATIVSNGSNTIYYDDDNPVFIKEGSTVTFQGDGTLNVNGYYCSGAVICENYKADIIIESGSYNFTCGVGAYQAIGANNLTITGGTVIATSTDNFYGIFAEGLVSISGGIVEARGDATGIYINGGDLVISNGTVTAEQTRPSTFWGGPESPVAGICVHSKDGTTHGTLTISGGTVNAIGHIGPGIGSSWHRSGASGVHTRSIIISGGSVTSSASVESQYALGFSSAGTCDEIAITEGITSLTLIKGPSATRMMETNNSSATITIDSKNVTTFESTPETADWTFEHLQRTVSTTTSTDDTWIFEKK